MSKKGSTPAYEENIKTTTKYSYGGNRLQGDRITEKEGEWFECIYCIYALIFILILGVSSLKENVNASMLLYKISDSMGIVVILCITLLWVLINGGLWTYCTTHRIGRSVLLIYIIMNIILLMVELVIYSLGVSGNQEILLEALQSMEFGITLLILLLSVAGLVLGIQLRKNLSLFKNSIGYVFILGYTIPFLSYFIESLLLGTTQIFVSLTIFVWAYSLSVLFLFFSKKKM